MSGELTWKKRASAQLRENYNPNITWNSIFSFWKCSFYFLLMYCAVSRTLHTAWLLQRRLLRLGSTCTRQRAHPSPGWLSPPACGQRLWWRTLPLPTSSGLTSGLSIFFDYQITPLVGYNFPWPIYHPNIKQSCCKPTFGNQTRERDLWIAMKRCCCSGNPGWFYKRQTSF